MASQHTPGPWTHRRPNQIDRRHRVFSGDNLIAVIDPHFGPDEVESNANLAAAAPDMLAVLIAFVDDDGRTTTEMLVERARAAIARAEGCS